MRPFPVSVADLPLSQILDGSPSMFALVEPSGAIGFVNRALEEFSGRTRDALVGAPIESIFAPSLVAIQRERRAEFFASPGERTFDEGCRLRTAQGDEVEIELTMRPVLTDEGVFMTIEIRDATEKKARAAAEQLVKETLTGAIEALEEAIVVYAPDDHVTACNSAFRTFAASLGMSNPIGLRQCDIRRTVMAHAAIPSDATATHVDVYATGGGPTVMNLQFLDGRVVRSTIRGTSNGGAVQTWWDRTRDARREEELRIARAAADAANVAKSEFLASMSHELRTPLNAILGFAQLLSRDRKEPLSQRHRDRAEQIMKGGAHLLHLIDDILDLARIEAGRVSISVEPVAVGDAFAELSEALRASAVHGDITLEIVEPPDDCQTVLVDRTRFLEILVAFGSNAIKYNKKEGRVRIVARSCGAGRARITVADTGIGVPIALQESLFQPFQRAGQETGAIEGTGVGLVIAKRLAALMNGDVGFSSVPGVSSEFWVEVPAHVPHGRTPPRRASPSVLPSAKEGRRRAVLYVEDNPANVDFMQDFLGELDVDLTVATTAEAGLELARMLAPDAIIMDINLGGMSGLDALQLLQLDARTKSIPVIALTASVSAKERAAGLAAGFSRYLNKPVQVDELESALAEATSRRPSRP